MDISCTNIFWFHIYEELPSIKLDVKHLQRRWNIKAKKAYHLNDIIKVSYTLIKTFIIMQFSMRFSSKMLGSLSWYLKFIYKLTNVHFLIFIPKLSHFENLQEQLFLEYHLFATILYTLLYLMWFKKQKYRNTKKENKLYFYFWHLLAKILEGLFKYYIINFGSFSDPSPYVINCHHFLVSSPPFLKL